MKTVFTSNLFDFLSVFPHQDAILMLTLGFLSKPLTSPHGKMLLKWLKVGHPTEETEQRNAALLARG